MAELCAVVLAAGDGTRMKSKAPKVMAQVLFTPMIDWVMGHCEQARAAQICAVVGSGGEVLEKHLDGRCEIVWQHERLGTGHAVKMAKDFLKAHEDKTVLVCCGDAPFLDAETILNAKELHERTKAAMTVVTAKLQNPTGYGRIVRTASGAVQAIVEQADADEKTLEIGEINSGAYLFEPSFLLEALEQLKDNNRQGEFYLTDTVSFAVGSNRVVQAFAAQSPDVAMGANDRKGLALLNAVARKRVLDKLYDQGVDIPFDEGIIISPFVQVGRDTTILPNTILTGKTVIGEDCVIGPGSHIENSTIGNGCELIHTRVVDAQLENGVKIGPYSNVRPNSHIKDGVKIGDFVEIKNSVLGKGTKVAHLTYVGDSDVGEQVNFGCGCVTVNYDGVNKARTKIGDHAFIGCNTNLIAPVKVGNGAYTAAGTTVDRDVPDNALAIGRLRQQIKEDWAKERNGK